MYTDFDNSPTTDGHGLNMDSSLADNDDPRDNVDFMSVLIDALVLYRKQVDMCTLLVVNCQFLPEPLKIKPEKCYGDHVMERRCCIFPPFFKREVARSCGALFALVDIDNEHNVTNLRRDHKNDCAYWKCLLKKYGMLDSENQLVMENYFSHLDRWTTLNPEFSTAVSKAKTYCSEEYRFYFPLTTCEFFGFQKCIRGFVNMHCPQFIQSKECMEWKEFYDECKDFFL